MQNLSYLSAVQLAEYYNRYLTTTKYYFQASIMVNPQYDFAKWEIVKKSC